MAVQTITRSGTITIEHIVRVVTSGSNHAFTTPPMEASLALLWAEAEKREYGYDNVKITCDTHCWCKH